MKYKTLLVGLTLLAAFTASHAQSRCLKQPIEAIGLRME